MPAAEFWIIAVRSAGVGQLVTVALAHGTPIPQTWDQGLALLSEVHRRFAMAQNLFIGGVMVFSGAVAVAFAPELTSGMPLARGVCAGMATWWGGRLVVLPWLRVGGELRTWWLKLGFAALHVECAAFGLGFGWLAVR